MAPKSEKRAEVENKRFNLEVMMVDEREELRNKNSEKANKQACKLLRQYIYEIGSESVDFENYEDDKLDNLLSDFFLRLRTKEGDLFKINTLHNIRYSLNRYLKEVKPSRACLIKSQAFCKSQEAFKLLSKKIKKSGKGSVKHYECITDEDLMKLYSSPFMDPDNTAESLQNKVMFDVRLFFCRRGGENFHDLKIDDFHLKELNGQPCIMKIADELDKNHKENDREAHLSGVMPAMPGHPLCPVASFSKYVEKLNSAIPDLWQRPKTKFNTNDQVWYTAQKIGENKLRKFLSTLSKKCELSTVYTNHSLRVTGIVILFRNLFKTKQLMSVSGHKSTSSLAIYQKVSTQEKMDMGTCLSNTLLLNKSALAQAPTRPPMMELKKQQVKAGPAAMPQVKIAEPTMELQKQQVEARLAALHLQHQQLQVAEPALDVDVDTMNDSFNELILEIPAAQLMPTTPTPTVGQFGGSLFSSCVFNGAVTINVQGASGGYNL